MEFTAVIRTLGKAGDKYQKLLNSLANLTTKPKDIIVYIAEGYPIPKETIGIEKYVYVKKGMVAQRALQYQEVTTEYILFLDDDLFLPPNSIEIMYDALIKNNSDVISPDVFPNASRPLLPKIMMTISGRMLARKDDGVWAYKVMKNAGYSYNSNPTKSVYLSQTNAGPCFFCKKTTMLQINFNEELWLDTLNYPLGEDQVMFYKMFLKGFKQLTIFNTGIEHLDAGTSMQNENKVRLLVYSDLRFKIIFWHRFLYLKELYWHSKVWDWICISYLIIFTLFISLIKLNFEIFKLKVSAIKDAVKFINSAEYKLIPKV